MSNNAKPKPRGEIRMVCPACDTLLDTYLTPVDEPPTITIRYATCQTCESTNRDQTIVKRGEEVIDMLDNPAIVWDSSKMAHGLSVLARAYKILAASYDAALGWGNQEHTAAEGYNEDEWEQFYAPEDVEG